MQLTLEEQHIMRSSLMGYYYERKQVSTKLIGALRSLESMHRHMERLESIINPKMSLNEADHETDP